MSSPFDYWDDVILRALAELMAAIPNARGVRIFPTLNPAEPNDSLFVVVYVDSVHGESYSFTRLGELIPKSVYDDPDQHADVITRFEGYVTNYIDNGILPTPTPTISFPPPIL